MRKLEKILEEIENESERYRKAVGTEQLVSGLEIAEEIIRKHMNDGWIPVEHGLPEVFGKYWATIRYSDGRISEPVVVDFRGVKQKYVVDTPNGREYETWELTQLFTGAE